MKKILLLLLLNFLPLCLFAQERNLSVKSPRIYGEDVRYVQGKMLEMGFTEIGGTDGYYDPKTEAAVKSFQSLVGLDPNGIISKKERDFFRSKNSGLMMKAVRAWKTFNPRREFSFWKRFGMKHGPNGKIYINEENGKTSCCKLLVVGDYFSYEYLLFKENETAYYVILREIIPVAPDGANPHECKEYEYEESCHLYFYIDGALYSPHDGALTKSGDEDIAEYARLCKELF